MESPRIHLVVERSDRFHAQAVNSHRYPYYPQPLGTTLSPFPEPPIPPGICGGARPDSD